MEPVFIPGRPAVMLGSGEKEWMAAVRAAGVFVPRHPRLRFVVSCFTRRGHHLDLDNLCSPVLDIVAAWTMKSVWATVEVGQPEGLWVSEAASPPPPADAEVVLTIARPPVGAHREDEPLPELRGAVRLGVDEPLGLHLAFHHAARRMGDFGFEGPVKGLIDDLAPILGGTLHAPHDHRIKDLRASRSRRERGVKVTCWRLG